MHHWRTSRFVHPDLIYAGCVDDLVTHIAASDFCAVPLLDGGGTRLKILEYFAGSKPVVSTHKGAEGLLLMLQRLVQQQGGELETVEVSESAGSILQLLRCQAALNLKEIDP